MADVRCEKCDLLLDAGCGCGAEQRRRAEEAAERARALQETGVVEAVYGGTCVTCRGRYGPGEPIKHTLDGWSGAICCPEVPRA